MPPSALRISSALPPTEAARRSAVPVSSSPSASPASSSASPRSPGSSICSSSMGAGRSDVEGFAATAAAFLVRVLEGEAGLQLVLDVIHLGADQEHRRLQIDQDGDT